MFKLWDVVTKRQFQRNNLFSELKDSVLPTILGNVYVTLKYVNCLHAQRHSKRKQTPTNYNKKFKKCLAKNSIYDLKVLKKNIRQCQ